MTTQFNPTLGEFIEHRVLSFKFRDDYGRVMDHILEQASDIPGVEIQNVCARLPKPFVEEMEKRLDILGVSKRQFIELALHDALNRVDSEIERRGVWEYLQAGGDPVQLVKDEEVA